MTDDDQQALPSDEDQPPSATPEGTLVIRTWSEPNQEAGFRARVIHTSQLDERPGMVSTADPAEVLAIVRQWLHSQTGTTHSV